MVWICDIYYMINTNDMNRIYKTEIGGFKVVIEKSYRNRTQFEWFLNIFYANSDVESIHLFEKLHLTRKSAIEEAKRAILINKPSIERVF